MEGDGSSGTPFLISSLEDLELIGTSGYSLSAYYELTAHIDAETTSDPEYNDGQGWIPIGNAGTPFTGSFDSKNYVIHDIYCNRPTTDYVGLFGCVDSNNIKNLQVISPYITGQDKVGVIGGFSGSISDVRIIGGIIHGKESVGGIIGKVATDFSISNCKADTTVIGTYSVGGIIGSTPDGDYVLNIEKCVALGNVVGTERVGGLAGEVLSINSSSIIDQCRANGEVTSNGGDNCGGLVGKVSVKTISNCYADGKVIGPAIAESAGVGGLIGTFIGDGELINSYSICPVDVGGKGLVGKITDSATATNSFWDTDISGRWQSALGVGKTTIEMKDESIYVDWDFETIWDGRPELDGTLLLDRIIGGEIIGASVLTQDEAGELSLEGPLSKVTTGCKVHGTVGNLILNGIPGNIIASTMVHAPPGEIFLTGVNPYLPIETDLQLFDLKPKKVAPNFVTYVTFKLRLPDREIFYINGIEATMNNDPVPIYVLKNGQSINSCQMEIDTNHLRGHWKKLDISVIISENSNQFRRYIRIL